VIFLTVGTQLPFDRLVSAVDRWAGESCRDDVVAQVGETDFVPEHLEWAARVTPAEFRQRMSEAELVISHAGMGSILTALEFDKPILVLPRRAALREMRNDHQLATAKWLADQGRVAVATDEEELVRKLGSLDALASPGQIRKWASEELLTTLREFIDGG